MVSDFLRLAAGADVPAPTLDALLRSVLAEVDYIAAGGVCMDKRASAYHKARASLAEHAAAAAPVKTESPVTSAAAEMARQMAKGHPAQGYRYDTAPYPGAAARYAHAIARRGVPADHAAVVGVVMSIAEEAARRAAADEDNKTVYAWWAARRIEGILAVPGEPASWYDRIGDCNTKFDAERATWHTLELLTDTIVSGQQSRAAGLAWLAARLAQMAVRGGSHDQRRT